MFHYKCQIINTLSFYLDTSPERLYFFICQRKRHNVIRIRESWGHNLLDILVLILGYEEDVRCLFHPGTIISV